MQYLGAISKMTMISVCFQGKPFNITGIQVYAPTTNAEEVEVEQFYEDLQDLLELTPVALQRPEDWKRSVFIPILKKGNAKECSNYHTIDC